MFDLMFSNPRIENRFRAILPADREIGGWFVTSATPEMWPGKYSRLAMKRVLGDANPLFIENIILIPNESDRPETQWKPWDVTTSPGYKPGASADLSP